MCDQYHCRGNNVCGCCLNTSSAHLLIVAFAKLNEERCFLPTRSHCSYCVVRRPSGHLGQSASFLLLVRLQELTLSPSGEHVQSYPRQVSHRGRLHICYLGFLRDAVVVLSAVFVSENYYGIEMNTPKRTFEKRIYFGQCSRAAMKKAGSV